MKNHVPKHMLHMRQMTPSLLLEEADGPLQAFPALRLPIKIFLVALLAAQAVDDAAAHPFFMHLVLTVEDERILLLLSGALALLCRLECRLRLLQT